MWWGGVGGGSAGRGFLICGGGHPSFRTSQSEDVGFGFLSLEGWLLLKLAGVISNRRDGVCFYVSTGSHRTRQRGGNEVLDKVY